MLAITPRRSSMLLLLLLCSSCVSKVFNSIADETGLTYITPTDNLHADGEFNGIDHFIRSTDTVANVLIVHGLTDKDSTHFDYLVERLAYKLKLRLDKDQKKLIAQGDPVKHDSRTVGFDAWKLYQWKFTSDEYPFKKINFYFLYWSPITKPVKKFLVTYDSTKYRTAISATLKDRMFINLFGDLALFINDDYKAQLYDCFLKSLTHVKGPTAVIGSGFGVQVMFEAMQAELVNVFARSQGKRLTENDSLSQVGKGINMTEQRSRMQSRLTTGRHRREYSISKVFLINNQLPFTGLLTVHPDSVYSGRKLAAQLYWAMDKYLELKKRHREHPEDQIEIVSFYDPNDPIGYRLPEGSSKIKVINVAVNTAEYWQIDPQKTTDFIMPRIKNKKTAHAIFNIIDQESNSQKLLTNLKGPADQTRSDFRVISALAFGKDYPVMDTIHEKLHQNPRSVEPRVRKEGNDFMKLVVNRIGQNLVNKIKRNLDVSPSILPFTNPSQFRDAYPDTIRALDFAGIDQSIAENSLTQIMTVHGVKNQEPDHFDELTGAIAKSLRFYDRPIRTRVVCGENEDCGSVGKLRKNYRDGTVKISEYENVYGKRLIIYAVYWSSITKPAKQWLDSLSIYPESSIVTRLIKKELITDGFADIELTFKLFRSKVEATIERAYYEMEKDLNDQSRPYKGNALNTYYITGSLGSRLLADFIGQKMISSPHVKNVQARTKTWFMLTNQLIMTAMKDVKLDHGIITYEEFYRQTFGPMLSLIENNNSKFEIVAFNDPNDLMSFVVPDQMMGVDGEKIHNNYVNLAQGVQVNMNALVKYTRMADRQLAKKHHKFYKEDIKEWKRKAKHAKGNPKVYDAYCEVIDLLTIAKERFDVRSKYDVESQKENVADVLKILQSPPLERNSELRKALIEKKRKFQSELYTSDSLYKIADKHYHDLRRNYNSHQVIARKFMKCLYMPGHLMPTLKLLSNNFLYQDFVVDFGTAHTGSKNSKVISDLIALGFEPVPKTVNDQNIYHQVHNAKQVDRPPK